MRAFPVIVVSCLTFSATPHRQPSPWQTDPRRSSIDWWEGSRWSWGGSWARGPGRGVARFRTLRGFNRWLGAI